jgi:hypothetical protein
MPDPATDAATAPARWLLELGDQDGIPLTQTNSLARAIVREAAERWPHWWSAEVHGPPHREADVGVLGALHEGLKRLRLVRRQGRKLLTTARGRGLAQDPAALLELLATDLGAADPFSETVASAIVHTLAAADDCEWDEVRRAAFAHIEPGWWQGPDGRPPDENAVGWVVGDVLRRGKAYGLIERRADAGEPRSWRLRIALSPSGRRLFDSRRQASDAMDALVFDATLVNERGVTARLAARADQPLTALHDAIQEAFGWWDDHLFSFWLDGVFWGASEQEFTSPITPDHGVRTAHVPLAELDLAVGAKVAYVFDFGDEWRVLLRLRERIQSDEGVYPRVLGRHGQAPPQYADYGDDGPAAIEQ